MRHFFLKKDGKTEAVPFFTSPACPTFDATPAQASKQTQVAAHLKKHGSITAWEIQTLFHTTDARKLAARLRKAGIIGETVMEKNADGVGKHARYMYNKQ